MIGDRLRPTRKASGFSLMEMLIVISLFSFASVILAQIFISFNRLHRQVSNRAILGQDMRFAMELIVRSARNNQIDYSGQPLASKDSVLRLKTPTGVIAIGPRPGGAGGDCQDATVTQCLALSIDGGTTWQPISAKRVNVTNFDVYVRPSETPFVLSGSSYTSDSQPFVSVNLGLQYLAEAPRDRVVLQAQTTVSSRVYLR